VKQIVCPCCFVGEGSHNPLGGAGCGYFDSHSTKHRCRSFPQHNLRRLRGVREAGAACRKSRATSFVAKDLNPVCSFSNITGDFTGSVVKGHGYFSWQNSLRAVGFDPSGRKPIPCPHVP